MRFYDFPLFISYFITSHHSNLPLFRIRKDSTSDIVFPFGFASFYVVTVFDSTLETHPSTKNFDSEGVPYIIADMNATPNITATQEKNDLRATTFDIDLKDAEGNYIQPANPVTLTLAYPAGMTQDVVSKSGYEMVVVHVDDNGNREVMSTVASNVKLTENGPQVTATSFSPYTVIWGTKDEITAKYPASVPGSGVGSVPQTGDSSNLALYAVLLTLSVGALAVLLVAGKRRANR